MPQKKSTLAVLSLLVFLLLSCRVWSAAPTQLKIVEEAQAENPQVVPTQEPQTRGEQAIPVKPTFPAVEIQDAQLPQDGAGEVHIDDPAGCLSAEAQAALSTGMDMLGYADSLIPLDHSLRERALVGAWNGYSQRYEYDSNKAIAIAAADVKNEYLLQRMLNALHVAGFVAWLRDSARPDQDVHILAVPLLSGDWAQGDWAPYIQAYWQGPQSKPEGDMFTRSALKLPPCAWMVSRGFAPQLDAGWWAQNQSGWPDYASAAQKYLAPTTQEANRVARQIDFLGSQLEGADTMCGPLSWSIMRDAGAFPPGMGAWLAGAKTFWLAKPTTNGRPWSIFPAGTFKVYHFDQPLGKFDFHAWPLYPGDFFYTYSAKDGYDHMFVVTEVDALGNVYSVTNLVQQAPEKKVTIERALLLNLNDPGQGVVHTVWTDRSKGRTGQAGFDVFRWDWMEKDILHQDALYSVLPGDTLGLVSVRWKTPADWIARYNQITAGVGLSVGQELRIPPNEDR
jgi:hypothetical protein